MRPSTGDVEVQLVSVFDGSHQLPPILPAD